MRRLLKQDLFASVAEHQGFSLLFGSPGWDHKLTAAHVFCHARPNQLREAVVKDLGVHLEALKQARQGVEVGNLEFINHHP